MWQLKTLASACGEPSSASAPVPSSRVSAQPGPLRALQNAYKRAGELLQSWVLTCMFSVAHDSPACFRLPMHVSLSSWVVRFVGYWKMCVCVRACVPWMRLRCHLTMCVPRYCPVCGICPCKDGTQYPPRARGGCVDEITRSCHRHAGQSHPAHLV